MKKPLFNFKNIVTLTKGLINELSYFDKENPAVIVNFTEGGSYPLIILTGENATGKSFFRRLYQASLKKYSDIECMHLSQEDRTYSGNCFRGFIYGDESYESTGAITSNLITKGIYNCQNREKRHVIIWDEPDLGLSDSYCAGVGVEIREFVEKIPELTFGVIVITHSKYLIKELISLNPHFLRFGDNKSLIDFINEEVKPKRLKDLQENSHTVFKNITAILNNKD